MNGLAPVFSRYVNELAEDKVLLDRLVELAHCAAQDRRAAQLHDVVEGPVEERIKSAREGR